VYLVDLIHLYYFKALPRFFLSAPAYICNVNLILYALLIKLINLGITENQEALEQYKIRITNKVALILSAFNVLFTLKAIFITPDTIILSVIATFAFLLPLLLNWGHLQLLAKFVASVSPPVIISVYHAMGTPAGATPMASYYLLCFSTTFIPYVVHRQEEKLSLIALTVINAIVIMTFPYLNSIFSFKELDSYAIYDTPDSHWMNRITAFAVSTTFVYLLLLDGWNRFLMILELKGKLKEKEQELKEVSQDRDHRIATAEAYELKEKKRKWASEGLASFVNLMRSNQKDIHQLSDEIIFKIVKIMDAAQAGLFVLNEDHEDDPHLKLIAAYAYDRKKFLEKRVEIGEGLLGQTFLEAESLHITEVPDHYTSIRSGLGGAQPNCLLLVPLKLDDAVFGILELASFKAYEDYQVRFLEEVGEYIASTMYTVQNNDKMKGLIEEAEQTQEEMKSQEEELKQNMEELEATHENQQRLEEELRMKIEELEKAQEINDTREKEKEPEATE
jgi:hypothetical protein